MQSCPDKKECGSSDAFSIQENGWGHCFSCGKNFSPTSLEEMGLISDQPNIVDTPSKSGNTKGFSSITETFKALTERGLTEETIKRYKIHVGKDDDKFVAKYPLFNTEGTHVGNKIRFPEKGFTFEGEANDIGLFGRHTFPAGSAKFITVVEGQDDAPAAFQIMGSKYPVVSVHSASTAERDVRKDFEYLNSFDTIVFCFDGDEPGRKAAKAAASCGFPLGKVKVLSLRKFKDSNEYLLEDANEDFVREWWQAPTFKPDGLKLGSDMWEEIVNRKESFAVEYPFKGLNDLTYGLRLSELVVVTADTGVGKTSVLKSIEHLLLTDETVKEKGYGVGLLHLEEPNGDTALGLLSIHNRTPYHLPDVERPEEDLRKAYDDLLNNDRLVIWDHFGSNSVDRVIDKVRHMAALGCKYIVIDHLSIIVSDQAGDERKQLDEITTKLKTLTMELDLAVIAVIHTNRQGQIRGTAGVEQLANIVMRLERDKTDPSEWRRNVTKITVEKNRFCGYTGPACYLWYNKETATLSELEEEEVATYEHGGELFDEQKPF
jgi:twinkle protein